ncbi:hypothetical protein QNN00_18005 [Bacillus velezensis]|nr:hypothetical protein [Bacillus velezensis]
MSLENGNALAPEIKFEALADTDTDEMAVVIEASRDDNVATQILTLIQKLKLNP